MIYLLTFVFAVASVGLWTVRVALTARGLRSAGSIVAMIEAVVFVLAFSHVLGSLETPAHMVIYGFGVGVGTFVGLSLDGLIHEAADADRTDPDRRNAMRFRQARRRRRLRDAVVPNFGLDLNIEEIVAELVYPIAIGLDGEREGEGE